MRKKTLAVAVLVLGLAPAAARAQGMMDLGSPADDAAPPAKTPTILDGLFAQADQTSQTNPSDQPTQTNEGGGTFLSGESGEPGTTTGYKNEANERWGPQAGDFEFTLTGTGTNNNTFSVGSWGVGGSVGYFLTPNWEFSFRQALAFSQSSPPSSWSGTTLGAIDYNFHFGRFVPFLGIDGGAYYGERRDWQTVVSPELGLRYYVYPKTFLFGMMQYEWPTQRSFENDGIFAWTVGIGFNF